MCLMYLLVEINLIQLIHIIFFHYFRCFQRACCFPTETSGSSPVVAELAEAAGLAAVPGLTVVAEPIDVEIFDMFTPGGVGRVRSLLVLLLCASWSLPQNAKFNSPSSMRFLCPLAAASDPPPCANISNISIWSTFATSVSSATSASFATSATSATSAR